MLVKKRGDSHLHRIHKALKDTSKNNVDSINCVFVVVEVDTLVRIHDDLTGLGWALSWRNKHCMIAGINPNIHGKTATKCEKKYLRSYSIDYYVI